MVDCISVCCVILMIVQFSGELLTKNKNNGEFRPIDGRKKY